MSLVTDPLAHTVEHLPEIPYRGADYVTTHSMIYAKFLACHNPHLKGIFVDSPNIRLEPADPQGRQRGRYLIDFSQLDVEVRRNRGIELDAYLDKPREVTALLQEDLAKALKLFEGMARAGFDQGAAPGRRQPEALGVRIDLPEKPFPVFYQTEAEAKYGKAELESEDGRGHGLPVLLRGGPHARELRPDLPLPAPGRQPPGHRRVHQPGDLQLRPVREGPPAGRHQLGRQGGPQRRPAGVAARGHRRRASWTTGDPRGSRSSRTGRSRTSKPWEAMAPSSPWLCPGTPRGAPSSRRPSAAASASNGSLWTLLRGPFIQNIDDVTFFGKNPDSTELFLF